MWAELRSTVVPDARGSATRRRARPRTRTRRGASEREPEGHTTTAPRRRHRPGHPLDDRRARASPRRRTPARPTNPRRATRAWRRRPPDRCISMRMVTSASPPVAGFVNRTAAWPGPTAPACPASSSSSWAPRAASVCSQRYAINGDVRETDAPSGAKTGVSPESLVARHVRGRPVRDLVRTELEEAGVEGGDQRDVEPVEPQHRRVRAGCGARATASLRSAGGHRGASPPDHRRPLSTRLRLRARSGTRSACVGARARPRCAPRYWTAAHNVGVAYGSPSMPGIGVHDHRGARLPVRRAPGPPPSPPRGGRRTIATHVVERSASAPWA